MPPARPGRQESFFSDLRLIFRLPRLRILFALPRLSSIILPATLPGPDGTRRSADYLTRSGGARSSAFWAAPGVENGFLRSIPGSEPRRWRGGACLDRDAWGACSSHHSWSAVVGAGGGRGWRGPAVG